MAVTQIRKRLAEIGDPAKAAVLQRFFKTGPGQYAQGDLFRGIPVPVLRRLGRDYRDLSLPDVERLLRSTHHEDRLLALLILIQIYANRDEDARERAYRLYLRNTRFINNWDLVDVSAEHIVGRFLVGRSKEPLTRLAKSKLLWERRIAILSTFHFIKNGQFDETFRIAEILLGDEEDLIHKAVGWMLREVGKRDLEAEEQFLKAHYRGMPRTMLRYAIERFPPHTRQAYLRGTI